jgi:hypothetical protein
MKRIVLLVGMLAMMVFWAAPALAQGQVEQGPDHANSICSFSGLNDVPDDPVEGGRVQSYGQGVSQGFLDPTDKETVERPGVLCNAHLFPYPEGFGEETP